MHSMHSIPPPNVHLLIYFRHQNKIKIICDGRRPSVFLAFFFFLVNWKFN